MSRSVPAPMPMYMGSPRWGSRSRCPGTRDARAEPGTDRRAHELPDPDVRLEGDPDAARVDLEHRDADPVAVYPPYHRRRVRGLRLGEVFAEPGPVRVFT